MKNMFFVLFLITLLCTATVSYGIPAFARQYKISCSTCHAPFPKLKPYGDEFAGNGMILEEEINERDFVTAGDDLLWLNKDFPVAVRLDAFAKAEDKPENKTDLQTPWGIKLLSGGPIYKNIGYYFYFYMSESGEIAGIEDAYVHFNNLFDMPLDIMVGQFQTCDPLMKRELRLTYEDYFVYKLKPGASNTNLTYDRGIMLNYTIDKTKTDIVAMLVNGNGKGEAENDSYDQDKYKNFGVRLKQDIGDLLSVGGFYYYGKESIGQGANKISIYGPDCNAVVGPLELTFQYLVRVDDNPDGLQAAPAEDVQTTGTVIELMYSPHLDRSRLFLIALYNKYDSDDFLLPGSVDMMTCLEYESFTLGATYLLHRNLRLGAEITRNISDDGNRFILGLTTGF